MAGLSWPKAGWWVAGIVIAAALAPTLPPLRFWLAKRIGPAAASTNAPPGAAPEKSVAVLPVADMSEKHAQEYFADGMAVIG